MSPGRDAFGKGSAFFRDRFRGMIADEPSPHADCCRAFGHILASLPSRARHGTDGARSESARIGSRQAVRGARFRATPPTDDCQGGPHGGVLQSCKPHAPNLIHGGRICAQDSLAETAAVPAHVHCSRIQFMISIPQEFFIGEMVMADDQENLDHGNTQEDSVHTDSVDKGRRAALRNIGALAGAAPAVALLLSPSASRANGHGGSPCEGNCGSGRGVAPGFTPNDTGAPGGSTGFLGKRES